MDEWKSVVGTTRDGEAVVNGSVSEFFIRRIPAIMSLNGIKYW